MQNVNKQLGNGSIIHRYKHILVINKVQTYSNVLSTPVKMFFNHLTAWLKPHRKKKLNVKKLKTRGSFLLQESETRFGTMFQITES
jgi:hypothetical protein